MFWREYIIYTPSNEKPIFEELGIIIFRLMIDKEIMNFNYYELLIFKNFFNLGSVFLYCYYFTMIGGLIRDYRIYSFANQVFLFI